MVEAAPIPATVAPTTVEDASLLPWLTATAYLHSVLIQERRGCWVSLDPVAHLGDLRAEQLRDVLTRSGAVTWVHAFTRSSIGPPCPASWP